MDNTATALVYLVYHLVLQEEAWKNIRAEVSTVNLQADDFVDTLRRLPYLNAFIRVRLRSELTLPCCTLILLPKEVLRARAPPAFFLERLVPVGGATLDGYALPTGTVSRLFIKWYIMTLKPPDFSKSEVNRTVHTMMNDSFLSRTSSIRYAGCDWTMPLASMSTARTSRRR